MPRISYNLLPCLQLKHFTYIPTYGHVVSSYFFMGSSRSCTVFRFAAGLFSVHYGHSIMYVHNSFSFCNTTSLYYIWNANECAIKIFFCAISSFGDFITGICFCIFFKNVRFLLYFRHAFRVCTSIICYLNI